MIRKIRLLTLVGAAVIGAGLAGSVAVAASTDGPPPMPPWVNSDGRVDMDKMPDEVQMLDSKGEVVVDAEGEPIMHKVQKGPPPLPLPFGGSGNKVGNEISREHRNGVETVLERPNLVAPGQNK